MEEAEEEETLIDSHCHLGLLEEDEGESSTSTASSNGLRYVILAVNDKKNWQQILEYYAHRDDVVAIGLGIHPWKAHEASSDWKERLKAHLDAHSDVIVGEIGLDKVAKTPSTGKVEWESQVTLFEEQMAIAATYQRPVSMHCVKAHGFIYEWLRKQQQQHSSSTSSTSSPLAIYPSSIAFHSYTGSPDMASSLLKLPIIGSSIYFGFSASVNLKNEHMEDKCLDLIRHLPPDRLLIESDSNDHHNIKEGMTKMLEVFAKSLNLEEKEVKKLMNRNVQRFLGRDISTG